jgi:hypothetical protein
VNPILDWAISRRWSSGLRRGQPVVIADDEYLAWRARRPAGSKCEREERAAAVVAAIAVHADGELPLDLVLEQLAVAAVIVSETA